MACLEPSFQDRKLATQKVLANWLPIALNNLGRQKVPVWSLTGTLTGWRWKNTTEPAPLIATLKEVRATGLSALDPEVRRYLAELEQPQTFSELVANYHVGRAMSNDGTFFGSIPELTIDAAVLPKTKNHVIPSLRPSSALTPEQVLMYDQKSSPVYSRGYQYMSRAFSEWRVKSASVFANLNYEIPKFLTTSSAGYVPERLSEVFNHDHRLRGAGKKRIVAFTGESDEMLCRPKFADRLAEPVYAVERVQIRRRARCVVGMNNPGILASLPFLRAAETLQKILRHASSGKQTGSLTDLSRLLHWSSSSNVLLSSMDVSGFDASVQMASQTQFVSMISEVLGSVTYGPYLCYSKEHDPNQPVGGPTLSPLHVLAADVMTRLQPQTTTVKGRVVPYVRTADPTFPSGLAFTTVHHTLRLIGGIYGDICENIGHGKVSSLQETGVQGDDIKLVFSGSLTRMLRDLNDVSESISNLGFETDSEASTGTAEFLQQRVILGRPVLYPDRVSLLTAEKPREAKGPMDKMSELIALTFDLGNRVRNPHRLINILYALYLFCACKVTVKVRRETGERVLLDKKMCEELHLRKVFQEDVIGATGTKQYEDVFLVFYCPLAYAWCADGPCLPVLSYKRKDGTFSPRPNFFSLRGDYNRTILFDLSLSPSQYEQVFLDDSAGKKIDLYKLLDHDHLSGLGIVKALKCASLLTKFTNLADEEIEIAYGPTIYHMAARIKQFQDPKLLPRSKYAYDRMRLSGVTIPESIVAAFDAETKLKGALTEVRAPIHEESRTAMRFILQLQESMFESRKERIYRLKSDYTCIYQCEWVSDSQIVHSVASKLIIEEGLALSADAYLGSISHVMLAYLGTRSSLAKHGDPFLQKMQRAFKDFVKGDIMLECGMRILRTAPQHFRDFCRATNLSDEQSSRLLDMMGDYGQLRDLEHRVIYSPRQYFMINSDPMAIAPHVLFPSQTSHPGRVIGSIQAQEWFSYHCPESRGERIKLRHLSRTLNSLSRN